MPMVGYYIKKLGMPLCQILRLNFIMCVVLTSWVPSCYVVETNIF